MNIVQAKIFDNIDKIVPIFKGNSRIRRGVVHKTICDFLGINLNNRNVRLIKLALKKHQPKEVRVRGLQYYKWEEKK